ncbi:hypothetical protein PLESTM_000494800 [Pleodorina starrii]|nr:hypothetical protein PLESTM_000494800 [Pleodorina starrii]
MLKGRWHPSAGGGEHAAALTPQGFPAAPVQRPASAAPRRSHSLTHPQRRQQQPVSAASAAPGTDAVSEPGGGGGGGAQAVSAATAPAPAAADADAVPRDLSLEPFRSLVAGRRFHCTMCGKCCTGDGEIWVSPEEAARIARHLNLSLQRFLDSHTKQYSKYKGWRMLKTAEGSSSCIFLGQDNKCSIHSVRPSQCSTYPWWPELTLDSEWEWEKANICEGFDHPEAGPLDVDEAARQLREANKMTQLRLLASEVRITPKVASWADQVLLWDEEVGGDDEGGSGRGGEAQQRGPQGPPGGKGGKGKGGGGGGGGGGGKGKGTSSMAR